MNTKNNTIHLPGLNGLRALAAISVLWGHVFQDTFGNWNNLPGCGIKFIADGVTMFFVISGFLITYLLLHESEKTNTIDIPKFYMRRILRIWPIYYGYILIVLGILSLFHLQGDLASPKMWYYLFFTANIPFITASGIWPIVHYWSIGVEEQFYLFWPWLVKFGKKNILKIAIIVCCVWMACKWGSYMVFGKCWAYRFFSVTRFDCMMIGSIGAIFYFNKNATFNKFFTNKWIATIAWILLLSSDYYAFLIPAPFRTEFMAVVSLAVIMSQLADKPFIINLENRFFDFVGKISYGIYVIHPILIFVFSKLYSTLNISLSNALQYILIYSFMTLITIGLAWLSYTFYEKPFLKLKSRFAIIQSKNSIDGK